MAQNFTGNPYGSSLRIVVAEPVDDRLIKVTLADRNAIPAERLPDGQKCWVYDPAGNGSVPPTNYVYYNGAWHIDAGGPGANDGTFIDMVDVTTGELISTTGVNIQTAANKAGLVKGDHYRINTAGTVTSFNGGASQVMTRLDYLVWNGSNFIRNAFTEPLPVIPLYDNTQTTAFQTDVTNIVFAKALVPFVAANPYKLGQVVYHTLASAQGARTSLYRVEQAVLSATEAQLADPTFFLLLGTTDYDKLIGRLQNGDAVGTVATGINAPSSRSLDKVLSPEEVDGRIAQATRSSGSGDMTKAEYATSGRTGIVDTAVKIEGVDTAPRNSAYGVNNLGQAGFHVLPNGVVIQEFTLSKAVAHNELIYYRQRYYRATVAFTPPSTGTRETAMMNLLAAGTLIPAGQFGQAVTQQFGYVPQSNLLNIDHLSSENHLLEISNDNADPDLNPIEVQIGVQRLIRNSHLLITVKKLTPGIKLIWNTALFMDTPVDEATGGGERLWYFYADATGKLRYLAGGDMFKAEYATSGMRGTVDRSLSLSIRRKKVAHGFNVGTLVNALGVKAQANTAVNAEVVGIVTNIIGPDDYVLSLGGRVRLPNLVPSEAYFLSDTVPGGLQIDSPTAPGSVSKVALITTEVPGEALFFNMRGVLLGEDGTAGGGAGSPAGGLTDQVLTKRSTLDGDTSWSYPKVTSFALNTPYKAGNTLRWGNRLYQVIVDFTAFGTDSNTEIIKACLNNQLRPSGSMHFATPSALNSGGSDNLLGTQYRDIHVVLGAGEYNLQILSVLPAADYRIVVEQQAADATLHWGSAFIAKPQLSTYSGETIIEEFIFRSTYELTADPITIEESEQNAVQSFESTGNYRLQLIQPFRHKIYSQGSPVVDAPILNFIGRLSASTNGNTINIEAQDSNGARIRPLVAGEYYAFNELFYHFGRTYRVRDSTGYTPNTSSTLNNQLPIALASAHVQIIANSVGRFRYSTATSSSITLEMVLYETLGLQVNGAIDPVLIRLTNIIPNARLHVHVDKTVAGSRIVWSDDFVNVPADEDFSISKKDYHFFVADDRKAYFQHQQSNTSSGTSAHSIQDEGITLMSAPIINFTGPGVTASSDGAKINVNVPNKSLIIRYLTNGESFVEQEVVQIYERLYVNWNPGVFVAPATTAEYDVVIPQLINDGFFEKVTAIGKTNSETVNIDALTVKEFGVSHFITELAHVVMSSTVAQSVRIFFQNPIHNTPLTYLIEKANAGITLNFDPALFVGVPSDTTGVGVTKWSFTVKTDGKAYYLGNVSTGGGDGGTIQVQDEGVSLGSPTAINFKGQGVTATSSSIPGTLDISIPGVDFTGVAANHYHGTSSLAGEGGFFPLPEVGYWTAGVAHSGIAGGIMIGSGWRKMMFANIPVEGFNGWHVKIRYVPENGLVRLQLVNTTTADVTIKLPTSAWSGITPHSNVVLADHLIPAGSYHLLEGFTTQAYNESTDADLPFTWTRYDLGHDALAPGGNNASAVTTIRETKTAHGFAVGELINIGRNKALADTPQNAEVIGWITAVPDANTFEYARFGSRVDITGRALSVGQVYQLSETVPGGIQAAAVADGKVQKNILQVLSSTVGEFLYDPGFIKGGNATVTDFDGYLKSRPGYDATVQQSLMHDATGVIYWGVSSGTTQPPPPTTNTFEATPISSTEIRLNF